jgi:hypothetical protein
VPTTRTPMRDRHFGLDAGRSLLIGTTPATVYGRVSRTAVKRDYMNAGF